MSLIRQELTLASIIWSQRSERKFCQKERKLNKYVSPAVLLGTPVSQHPVSFLLCHSQFPNKVISHIGLGLFSGSSVSEPQHLCCSHLLLVLWRADLLARALPISTDVLCSALLRDLLLARVLLQYVNHLPPL